MIDVESESLVELKKARYPGRDPHVATKYRHAFNGVNGVKLETVKIGGRLYTSREAVLRFVQRCTSPATPPVAATSARRHREIQTANDKLDRLGVGKSTPRGVRAVDFV